ncbi:alanine:cation symporter family protein [Gorillibacterium massiliense]|uniref:YkvI family membrane protein n=1 Tax=Gorillibacterium massiliense TaxID=1280390 RepID=UPI0005931DE8|nr:alanine:cation symporter family protein [Gorillibacterium massiliense]
MLQALQVAFTYIGTVVGAGFASGQEILQFFTQYERIGSWAIGIAAMLFVLAGIKLMVLAAETGSRSFEDLNRLLLGKKAGTVFSMFMLVVLLGTSAVMVAGAGSLFTEQFHIPFQLGALITVICGYFVIIGGIRGLLTVNTIVVPIMLLFTVLILIETWKLPTASNWLILKGDFNHWRAWLSPVLYSAFNLATAQAVLVPLGAEIRDRKVLIWGGAIGGISIGGMLMIAHFALSAHMPGIRQYEIPMGQLIGGLGTVVQLIYLFVILGEIFTTLVADVFGLSLQVQQKSQLNGKLVIICLLVTSFLIAQAGFSSLLSLLYPLFGLISFFWLGTLFYHNSTLRPGSAQH